MRSSGFFAAVSAALLFLTISCDLQEESSESGTGRLRLKFDPVPVVTVKAVSDLPDTNDFLLTIKKEGGKTVFNGLYCEAQEEFELASGTYHVYVRSVDFEKPAFSEPQYGDEQCVVVPAGGDVSLHLKCSQLNAGVKLDISPGFLTEYPSGVLFLKDEVGKLMYSYSERRVAYFKPGSISLILSNGGSDEVLLTRVVAAQEILSLKISLLRAQEAAAQGISISLDTTRTWNCETYILGSDGNGSDYENAMTVNQALASAGTDDVWVNGFIVGGDLTSTSASFAEPFKSATNIILASRKSVTARDNCIAVQLSSGEIRDALNLAENPEMLGREVCLRGDIVASYYGLIGLKNVSEYVLK